MSLKLISLNIYGNRFLDRQVVFFQKEQPDVLCLQEVFEQDLPLFEKALGMKSAFIALGHINEENKYGDAPRGPWGIAILSSFPMDNVQHSFYQYERAEDSLFPILGGPETLARALLWVNIFKDNVTTTVATTHFTWAPDAKPTDLQFESLNVLLPLLNGIPEFVLTGDFNAPRGYAIFDKIASLYTDNIPKDVTTTIDQNLHRVKGLQLVIDALFSTPQYSVDQVRVIDGVSDHCAVGATITRK